MLCGKNISISIYNTYGYIWVYTNEDHEIQIHSYSRQIIIYHTRIKQHNVQLYMMYTYIT